MQSWAVKRGRWALRPCRTNTFPEWTRADSEQNVAGIEADMLNLYLMFANSGESMTSVEDAFQVSGGTGYGHIVRPSMPHMIVMHVPHMQEQMRTQMHDVPVWSVCEKAMC